MHHIFPGTAEKLEEWKRQPEVLGVLLVGSKSRGYDDELSDDDPEVLLSEDAFAALAPADCIELKIEGEGPARKLIYDAQLTSLADLQRKASSPFDLDHWPYEAAQVLFDRDGRVAEAVAAAGIMDPDFRRKRLQHATIDAWTSTYRAEKTLIKRDMKAAGHLLVVRAAVAMCRVVFALEGRWVPLDHWLEPELRSLKDPAGAGAEIIEALMIGAPGPLQRALDRLAERLELEGVPADPRGRRDLFLTLIHVDNADERAIHGLH